MTAHNGRGQGGDLPYEGVVLPANGESWTPEQQGEGERGRAPQPAAGQPWGQPWGPDLPTPPAEEPAIPPPAAPPSFAAEAERPSLPPTATGGGHWAPPPPSAPPAPPSPPPTPPPTPPASGGPPVPYEPPAAAPQPGPYGYGHQHAGPDADATQMLPPQQTAPEAQFGGPQYEDRQYGGPQPGAGALPPAVDADATQMLPPQQPGAPGPAQGAAPEIGAPWPPPQPGTAAADATQMLPPQQGGPAGAGWAPQSAPGDAEATQMLPPQPGAGDVDATQMMPPQQGLGGALPPETPYGGQGSAPSQAAGPPPAAAQYGIRPGAPGERQPPSEFDNLFRSDAPPAARGAGGRRPDLGGPDTAPGAAPYGGRAARRNAGRERDRRGGMSPAVLAGVGVVTVLAVGLGVGALISGGEEEKQPDGSPTAPVAGGLPSNPVETAGTAEEQAKQLNKLLEKSNNSRNAVIRAFQNIKACRQLDQAAADLRAAAKQRNGLVTRLSEIETAALPDSAALGSALTKAWKASAEADNAYAAWADQVAGKKGCKKGEARTTHQTAVGNRASGEATAAKKKAAALWNPTARKYGLPERQYTQL